MSRSSDYPDLGIARVAQGLSCSLRVPASLESERHDASSSGVGCTHGEAEETRGGTVTYQSIPPRFVSGRYTAERFHTRGGEGEIWLARDERIGRRVAIKRLRNNSKLGQKRFLAEAQIIGQLEHPGVVPVHDLGKDENGKPFYAMKFVEGRTLESAIDDFHATKDVKQWEREVERRRLLECFLDVCDTIAYAHSRGVMHRDIKPENVMLGPFGETLVLDWGLGKVLDQPEIPTLESVELSRSENGAHTQAGSVLGTPAYMPPELASGHAAEVGVTCDVYLLGATLYHLLTGQAPRTGNSYTEMIEMARTVVPTPPRQLDKEISQSLEAVCLKAMSKSPADRYQSALAIAEEVRRHLAGQPISAYREQLPARVLRWACGNWQPLKWSLATAALLVPLVFWWTIMVYAPLQSANDLQRQAPTRASGTSEQDKLDDASVGSKSGYARAELRSTQLLFEDEFKVTLLKSPCLEA